MTLVLDASVVVKWLLDDPEAEADVDRALEILRSVQIGTVGVLQPPHWLIETAAVLTRLRPDAALTILELLDAMELPVESDLKALLRACRMAETLAHHLFDTLYHAVALEHDATLVTADEQYQRKARKLGGIVLLRDWEPV